MSGAADHTGHAWPRVTERAFSRFRRELERDGLIEPACDEDEQPEGCDTCGEQADCCQCGVTS